MNMTIEHWFYVHAKCPVNGAEDVYSTTIRTRRFVKVEEILAAAAEYKGKSISQEDLTVELAIRLGVEVETIGYHSSVRTTVRAGGEAS
jgi:hypothetical protein